MSTNDQLANYKSQLLQAGRRKILQHVPVSDFNMEPEEFLKKYSKYFFPLTVPYLLELCQKDPMVWHWLTGVGIQEIRLEGLRDKAIDAIESVLEMDDEGSPKMIQAKLMASKMLLDLAKIERPKETMLGPMLPTSVRKKSLVELEDKKRMLEERIQIRKNKEVE
jgi:hypothetical protein